MTPSERDLKMMRHCIALSEAAAKQGELPFSCVICKDADIVVEATNRVVRDADVTRHAEIIAISDAQRVLGRKTLADCTLYSNVEPCPMCSFPIRETRVGRVVFAISSPMMGGFSKWNILGDDSISDAIPEIFGAAPSVTAGVLYRDAARIWRNWNPLIWGAIRLGGYFEENSNIDECLELRTKSRPRHVLRSLLAQYCGRH